MNGWLKSVRPRIVVMAGVLSIVSFRVSLWNDAIAFLVAAFVVVAASATMAHNDWRDRYHDVSKGKNFALIKATSFFNFVVLLWVASACLATCLWFINQKLGFISLAIIASGLIYSEARCIPLIPAILVAVTSASPALYPVFLSSSKFPVFLFAATALLIFGREILKDLDDCCNDMGYKWTLPIAIGERGSKIIAGLFLLPVSAITYFISPYSLIGAPSLLFASIYLFLGRDHKKAKTSTDIAMALILLSLLIGGA